MEVAALFGVVHLCVVICTIAAVYGRLLVQRRVIRGGRYALVAGVCSVAIAAISGPVAEFI